MHSDINVDTTAPFTTKLHLNMSIGCNITLIMLVNNVTCNCVSKSNMPLNDAKLMLRIMIGTTDNALVTK